MRIAALALVILAAGTITAEALDRRMKIINNSSMAIREFYASNTGTNNWEEDILGVNVLAPGESVIINIDDGSGYCKFDFKAIGEDGREAIAGDINVCEMETFTFND